MQRGERHGVVTSLEERGADGLGGKEHALGGLERRLHVAAQEFYAPDPPAGATQFEGPAHFLRQHQGPIRRVFGILGAPTLHGHQRLSQLHLDAELAF